MSASVPGIDVGGEVGWLYYFQDKVTYQDIFKGG
jgi:hypothetical protein